ncbi:hypothetical protein [Escherichia coli]|uniref:hypothetical protein n=1 Tax=Escherichia coli TaxID=562 RepID=UPI0027BA749E|nr:hypothetical protein [Escherichia coli]
MTERIYGAVYPKVIGLELKIAYQKSGEWPVINREGCLIAAEFMKEAPEGKYQV